MSETYTPCVSCGDEASGHHALPVDTDGEIVSNDYGGEWAGMPACERCFAIHAAVNDATGKADERNPGATVRAVLEQYDAATRQVRGLLAQARQDLKIIQGAAREALDSIGHAPAGMVDDASTMPVIVAELRSPKEFPRGTFVRVRGGGLWRRVLDGWQQVPESGPGPGVVGIPMSPESSKTPPGTVTVVEP